MIAFLLRRLVFAAGTVVITAFFAYGVIRLFRPELFPGDSLAGGTWHDVERALVHRDFGGACMFVGCPPLRRMWEDGAWGDLFLLSGGMFVAVVFGVAGGVWCAARPRSLASRALESVAMLAFCTPAYVSGFTVLLLFAPPFGLFQLPYFFDPHSYSPPFEDPWNFIRSMILPWIVVGAPLAGAVLRLTLGLSLDQMGENYVRTAIAKGVPHARVVSRHAGPPTYVSVASLVGVYAPFMVTNTVLVEYVFSVPGFFRHTKRALGQAPGWPPTIDFATLQAIAVWAAVLIVALSLLADLAIVVLDPTVRATGRTPG